MTDVTTRLWIAGLELQRTTPLDVTIFFHYFAPNVCPGMPIFQLRLTRCVKILLVDDSKPILHENERVLHKAGYDVVCAEDGECALKLAREHKPDLILSDMILPKLSGPEVLERLKKDAATADIPVIVLSSLTEKTGKS